MGQSTYSEDNVKSFEELGAQMEAAEVTTETPVEVEETAVAEVDEDSAPEVEELTSEVEE